MTRSRTRVLGMLLITVLLCVREASAHRDDYLNETLVYTTLEQSELEAEYWFDYGRQSGGHGDFSRHSTAIEFGITDSWMVDGRVSVASKEEQGTNFDLARLESRYRFLDEGVLPVDIAVSFEVNSERKSNGSRTVGIEPRLILSKDLGEKLNLTANLSEEIPLDSESSAFLVAFGSRFNWTKLVRVGSEFQYNFGEHSGLVIPQLWFAFPRDITMKIGYSIGVDQEPDDFFRIALEAGF